METPTIRSAGNVQKGDRIVYWRNVYTVLESKRDLGAGYNFRFRLAGFGWTYAMPDVVVV